MVCMYVCMYVCNVCNVCSVCNVCIAFMYVCMYACMYACMYVCTYVCMYVCNVYIYNHFYIYVYVNIICKCLLYYTSMPRSITFLTFKHCCRCGQLPPELHHPRPRGPRLVRRDITEELCVGLELVPLTLAA